jgi:hypothetical protein
MSVSVTLRPRFTPGKGPPVPIVQEVGWAPEPVWTQRIEEKFFRLYRGSNIRKRATFMRLLYSCLISCIGRTSHSEQPARWSGVLTEGLTARSAGQEITGILRTKIFKAVFTRIRRRTTINTLLRFYDRNLKYVLDADKQNIKKICPTIRAWVNSRYSSYSFSTSVLDADQ